MIPNLTKREAKLMTSRRFIVSLHGFLKSCIY